MEKKILLLSVRFSSIRPVMAVSRTGVTLENEKLFWGIPDPGIAWGRSEITFWAKEVIALLGITLRTPLALNGARHVTPLIVWVVEGSKISPWKTGLLLSQGLMAPVGVGVVPNRAEKSPCRSAALGIVLTLVAPCF